MTKENAIKELEEDISSFLEIFKNEELYIEDLDDGEIDKYEKLTCLSYLYPYFSLSILLKDILRCGERMEKFLGEEQIQDYHNERENFFSLISEQYFFKERFIQKDFRKDETYKLPKEILEDKINDNKNSSKILGCSKIEHKKKTLEEKESQKHKQSSNDEVHLQAHTIIDEQIDKKIRTIHKEVKSHLHSSLNFVDLGLPSGVKWATYNIDYYNKVRSIIKSIIKQPKKNPAEYFAREFHNLIDNHNLRLPTKEDFEELRTKCKWRKDIVDNKHGYTITGPNEKQQIFLHGMNGYYAKYLSCHIDSNFVYFLEFDKGGNRIQEIQFEEVIKHKYKYLIRLVSK